MPVDFRSMAEAEKRVDSNEPLNAEEARALFRWLNPLHHRLPRIQTALALQQIAAINRFNKASGKLTIAAIFVAFAQLAVGVIALIIALHR